jgi:hypothetical protein
MVIVSSESYDASAHESLADEDGSGDDGWSSRDVIATICQARKDDGVFKGQAELCFVTGDVWDAMTMDNGNYEFVTVDEWGHKTVARWVSLRRRNLHLQNPAMTTATQAVDMEKSFNFSLIDPNARRHPIIASINRNTLDILNQYTTVSSSAAIHPPTTPFRTSDLVDIPQPPSTQPPEPRERTSITVDDDLRRLIMITGIWVAFREGWSHSLPSSDAGQTRPISPTAPIVNPANRSASLPKENGKMSYRGDSLDTHDRSGPFHGVSGRIIRTGTQLLHRGCSSGAPNASYITERGIEPPKRAVSAGTAFIQRNASRRANQSVQHQSRYTTGDTTPNFQRNQRPHSMIITGAHESLEASASVISQSTLENVPRNVPQILSHRRGTESMHYPPGYKPAHEKFDDTANQQTMFLPMQVESEGIKKKLGRFNRLLNIFRRGSGAP